MPRLFVIASTSVVAGWLAGCTVHGTTEPVGYAQVTSVPVDYQDDVRYPRTVYGGRTVYYVDDRWGYRDRDRWVYYRSEPPELYRYRTTVRQAPPAPRQQPVYSAPPAQNQPVYSAPPAGRGR